MSQQMGGDLQMPRVCCALLETAVARGSADRLNVWQVGDAKITRVVEGGDFSIDPALLFAADRHAVRQQAWLRPSRSIIGCRTRGTWNTRQGIRPATSACTSCRAASTPSSRAT